MDLADLYLSDVRGRMRGVKALGEGALAQLWAEWEGGWAVFLDALDHLTPADLTRTLTIRGEPHTVLEAIQRQVAHYSGHVYQLVFLVKTLRGEEWETLSIPRGGSAAFTAQMRDRHGLS